MVFRQVVLIFSFIAVDDLKRIGLAFFAGWRPALGGYLGHRPGRRFDLRLLFCEFARRELVKQEYDSHDDQRYDKTTDPKCSAVKQSIHNAENGKRD